MKYIVLGGLGQQGRAITCYLLDHINSVKGKVLVADLTDFPPEWVLEDNRCYYARKWLDEAKPGDIVLSCLPTDKNKDIARECYLRDLHYLDLGGDLSVSTEIRQMQKKGLVFKPDQGVAPGKVSSLAKEAQSLGYSGIKIYCGGVPKYPKLPIGYVKSFSVKGLLKEYTGIACIRRDNRLVRFPALSERESIFIEGFGVMEADLTSGSLSSSAHDLDNLDMLEYKTLRYPGHFDYVKNNILNQPDPEQVLEEILEPVSADNPDMLILEVFYYKQGVQVNARRWLWEYCAESDLSAMSQATGFTAAQEAIKIAEEHRDETQETSYPSG
jgi:saccharopine dehydrogenase-like NADP-dependent oxidoreductase